MLVASLLALFLPQEQPLATIPEDVEVVTQLVATSNLPTYERRSSLTWSADGTQVAYVGSRGEKWVPVVDSRIGQPYDSVKNPVVAGGHVAFQVVSSTSPSTVESWLWVDGATLGPEDSHSELFASADGQTIAFWTQPDALYGNTGSGTKQTHVLAVARVGKSGKWTVGRGEEWQSGGSVVLVSADGGRVVTTALGRSGWVVLARTGKRDKEISDEHRSIAGLAMSANGSAVAYVADGELHFKKKRVGKGLKGLARPAVDPKGKHVAYVHSLGARVSVGVDNEKQPVGLYDHVLELAFDSAGAQLAFVANEGGRLDDQTPGQVLGGESWVVVRPVRGKEPWKAEKRFLEVRDLIWDAESGRLAYCARDADGWRVVCGESVSASFDHVGRPHFAADGMSVGFGVRVDRDLWWKTLALD